MMDLSSLSELVNKCSMMNHQGQKLAWMAGSWRPTLIVFLIVVLVQLNTLKWLKQAQIAKNLMNGSLGLGNRVRSLLQTGLLKLLMVHSLLLVWNQTHQPEVSWKVTQISQSGRSTLVTVVLSGKWLTKLYFWKMVYLFHLLQDLRVYSSLKTEVSLSVDSQIAKYHQAGSLSSQQVKLI